MKYYRIADLTIQSAYKLPSFSAFECDSCTPKVILERTNEFPTPGTDIQSGTIIHRKQVNGWFFFYGKNDRKGLFVNNDYSHLKILGVEDPFILTAGEWLVRIALECWLARNGFVSLHSAAISINEEAIALTGPSGIGKSTRAEAFIETLNGELVNGDRPLINVNNMILYGVPWDGKEQCFRNVYYPIKAICEVRRSESVYIRKMSFSQRQKLLMRQSFLPMWDNETATIQMANITCMAKKMNIFRIFSGPTSEDVRAIYNALQEHHYLKEESDMKAKPGFVLRNVVDEFILMPIGENIGKFNGTVLLNEVSAFVWEKLQNPLSKEDLLKAILDEFEVDKATASADLDALLETLRGYGVIEDD